MACQPALQFLAVEPAERDSGQFDLETASMSQKAIEKYLAGVAQAHTFRHFIERADQHQTPEPRDDPGRLPVALEPG